MASTTLTLPAAETIPASAQSFGTAHGTILALDLGTTTGFALRTEVGAIISGTVSFARPLAKRRNPIPPLQRWLTEIENRLAASAWSYYEQVRRHAGVDAAHAFGGWLAILTAWCDHHEIDYQGVPVGTDRAVHRRQGQRRQGRGHRCGSRARVLTCRRQRGRRARHPAVGDRNAGGVR